MEKDVCEFVNSMFERQLFGNDELSKIIKSFKHAVELLQNKHARCKPLKINYPSNYTGSTLHIYEADLFTITLYKVNNIDGLEISCKNLTDEVLTHEVRKNAL